MIERKREGVRVRSVEFVYAYVNGCVCERVTSSDCVYVRVPVSVCVCD